MLVYSFWARKSTKLEYPFNVSDICVVQGYQFFNAMLQLNRDHGNV